MKSGRSIKHKGLEHRLQASLNHSGDLIKVPSKCSKARNDVFDLIDSAYSIELKDIRSVRRFLLELIENNEDYKSFKEFYSRRCLGSALKVSTWESIRELIYLMLETRKHI